MKPLATPFNASEAIRTDFHDTPAGYYDFDQPVTLAATGRYKWRARIRTNDPVYPVSAWFYPSGNGPAEADLCRTQ